MALRFTPFGCIHVVYPFNMNSYIRLSKNKKSIKWPMRMQASLIEDLVTLTLHDCRGFPTTLTLWMHLLFGPSFIWIICDLSCVEKDVLFLSLTVFSCATSTTIKRIISSMGVPSWCSPALKLGARGSELIIPPRDQEILWHLSGKQGIEWRWIEII